MSRRSGLQITDVDRLGPKVFIRIESIPVSVNEELSGAAARCRLSVSEAFGWILEAPDLVDLAELIDRGDRIESARSRKNKDVGLHITPMLKEKLWNAVKISNSKRCYGVGLGVAAGLILVALRGTMARTIVEAMMRRIHGTTV